ncbi:MAG: NAD(P)/FAD-dependent oxidoreductase [Candidatus Taylorbacteria bacterium]|nr:NAD(P)/FAD-dependent oxidoreductase [Candidatus Taylorbacteria bacterium]
MQKTKTSQKPTIYDVIVIGGGPAGMMAANRAAERGLRVLLLEKNSTLGKKLLITGGGRCNVTNAEFDTRKLLEKYRDAGKYLFSPFSKWNVQHTLEYLHTRGLFTKVENEKRVFPVTDKAQSVWDVLVRDLKKNKVVVQSDTEVTGFVLDGEKITGVNTKQKGVLFAKAFILATGGKSHPETGSTGEGFEWLQKIGHTVSEPDSSLVPIKLKTKPDNIEETRTVKNIVSPLMSWFKDLQGITLQNIRISVFEDNTRKFYKDGKILFTHFGVTGPTILNMSKDIGEILKYADVTIHIDLFPKMNHKEIDLNILETFKSQNVKKIKNAFGSVHGDILGTQPRALYPIILMLSGINPEKTCSTITKDERNRLVHTLKDLKLTVDGLLGAQKAIVTSGGISLDEIEWKNMSSKKYPNLHIVGDVLDIDRPSGGYSLQLCWTTGFVAGDSVLE